LKGDQEKEEKVGVSRQGPIAEGGGGGVSRGRGASDGEVERGRREKGGAQREKRTSTIASGKRGHICDQPLNFARKDRSNRRKHSFRRQIPRSVWG